MHVAIGIDIGGTTIKGILLAQDGTILHRQTIATNDDAKGSWLPNVLLMAAQLQQAHHAPVQVIGLSCPGLADQNNKCIAHLPQRLAGIENYNWEAQLGLPTFVLNDAHAALVAEAKYGALQGYQNAVLLTLGTGVGGGILINGELYQGQLQMAGHFGHVCINTYDDERSIAGMPGSIEYALGNYSVERRSQGRFSNTTELVAAYQRNDVFATWLWLDMVRKLALVIASVANSLSPQMVVLAGGITQAGEALMTPLNQFLPLYEQWPAGKQTPVQLAHFSDLPGAIGAAAFGFSKLQQH